MNPHFGFKLLLIVSGSMLAARPAISIAQDRNSEQSEVAAERIPEAPVPHIDGAESEVRPQPAKALKSDRDEADEQIKAQEHQRVLGVVPTFNITYLGDATVSMTPKQKFGLAFRSAIDPVAFAVPFFVAGYDEVFNDNKGFGWGVEGLGKRAGAAYLDSFTGTMLGNALLPSLLHQDPRYYRMGHGSTTHRLLYATSTTVICKHDNTGKWEPNYSNIAGNIGAGMISTLYYPPSSSGSNARLAISNGLIVTAEGAIGAVFSEFWPDLSRKWLHKDPSNGIDAQMKAVDEAKKNAAHNDRLSPDLR
jgi:hypothetical protein